MSEFTDYMAEVVRLQLEHEKEGFGGCAHKWPEVTDFCLDAHDDPQWEVVISVETMIERIRTNGWTPTDRNAGEAAMNTWYAFKGLKRTSER